MNIQDQFPSKWVCPEDLGTKRVTVEIIAATMEPVFNRQTNKQENKLALAFKSATKMMLLNKTQAFAIAAIAGSNDTDNWPGHSITLRAGVAPNRKPTIIVEAPPVTAPVANLNSDAVATA